MNREGITLVNDSDVEWETVDSNVRRKVMTYNADLMMVKVEFEQGGVGAVHQHPHLQMSYVASGVFELTIGDQTKVLRAGDAYFVPSNVWHGAVCLEAGQLIDVFNPHREDFV